KRGPLSGAEFEEAKMHPQRTVDIIRPVQSLNDLVPLVLFHHERWDGNGYPRGLEKKGIPIGAQIVGVADVFQALSSARPYREAYSREQVVELITSGSGTQFDPQVAAAFLTVLKQDQSDAEDSSVPKESTP
ncbi:MAG: HD-GYP domain-containing protein, partial [Terriglobia bacterium]